MSPNKPNSAKGAQLHTTRGAPKSCGSHQHKNHSSKIVNPWVRPTYPFPNMNYPPYLHVMMHLQQKFHVVTFHVVTSKQKTNHIWFWKNCGPQNRREY